MNLTHETRKPTIAIDVDGVIADYSKGWQGEGIIGDPMPGAREFLQRLRDAGWKIVIFTTRGNEEMADYCARHSLVYDEINDNSSLRGRNPGKPIAAVYLDDRGITFTGDFDQAFEQVMRFKVWYEKKPELPSNYQGYRIPCWKQGMTPEEERDIAYHERNLLALRFADGWYFDTANNWQGWRRVLSLDGGKMTFHIPDNFPVGNLPEIKPNWDGHSTEEKWRRVLAMRGIEA